MNSPARTPPNLHRHEFDGYRQARPLYTEEFFYPLQNSLRSTPANDRDFRILDLGSGPGTASLSWLNAQKSTQRTQITLVDETPGMLDDEHRLDLGEAELISRVQSAEDFVSNSTPASPYDLVLILSALHWMDAARIAEHLPKLLSQESLVFVGEYQFPKAERCPELNAIIKEQFNKKWKAPAQKPRGKLKELIFPFQQDFQTQHHQKSEMKIDLDQDAFFALLRSQSRWIHAYQADASIWTETDALIRAHWPKPTEKLEFTFKTESFLLKLRSLSSL
jgi:SAM-dependent methyltransferase